jgi:hypothetical protein
MISLRLPSDLNGNRWCTEKKAFGKLVALGRADAVLEAGYRPGVS